MSTQRSARRLSQTLRLKVSTFGSPESFNHFCINISTSGMLVASFDTVPFNIKTLLEVQIDPEAEFLPKTIKCVAKIVRIEKGASEEIDLHNSTGNFIEKVKSLVGIRICDISSDDRAQLDSYINARLEG